MSLARAASLQASVSMQRASSLPTAHEELRYAASMPSIHDQDANRPCCMGMWKPQQLIGFLLGVILQITCSFGQFIDEYPKANDMLGLTLLCACFWVFEVMPLFATALVPMVLEPFLDITGGQVVIDAYWNKISALFLGAFLVDVALENVGLPRRLALLLLMKANKVNPTVLLGLVMAFTWILSMFANSIATTLMICPLAVSLMNAAEESEADESGSTSEEEVPNGSRQMQQLADGILMGIAYAATCGGLATLIGSPSNLILAGQPLINGQVSFSAWFGFALPISFCSVVFAYIILAARYTCSISVNLGQKLVEEEYEQFCNEVGWFSRDELLVGIVQVLLFIILLLQPWLVHGLQEMHDREVQLVNGAVLALACGLLLFLLPSQVRRGQSILTWKDAQEKVQWGVLLLIGGGFALSSGFTQSGLDIVLGKVFARMLKGLSPLLSSFIITLVTVFMGHVFSSIAAASIILPILGCASETTLVHPLEYMLPACVGCSFNFMWPTGSPANIIALAKSRELFRPLRVRDFATNGAYTLIGVIAVATFLSHCMGVAIFHTDQPYPSWACDNVASNCLFAYIPGVVRGQQVETQACMYLDEYNDELCRIWNGTLINVTSFNNFPSPYM